MLKDHDRPLNKRGLRDSPIMASQVLDREGAIQQIVASSAKRADHTARFFQKEHAVDPDRFHTESNLYHGSVEDYLDGIRTWASDDLDNAALFAHNPGMSYLANQYADYSIDNVPTCGVLKVVFNVERFADISKHNGRLDAFYYPKMFV